FYLLGGYLALLLALQGRSWMIAVAVTCWALALATKLQVLPFWALSLALPLAVAAGQRRWKPAGSLLIGLLGSYAGAKLLGAAWHWFIRDHTVAGTPVSGLLTVTAVVTRPTIRVTAIILVCLFALPTFLGLAYAARRFVAQRGLAAADVERDIVRLALLALAGGWLVWYVALSAAWLRYLFPAVFVGSMFAAALLQTLTTEFNLKTTLQCAASEIARLRMSRQGAGAMLAILLIALAFTSTLVSLHWAYFVNRDLSVVRAAEYLNSEIEPDALIETYNSELFLLLNRDYHYPPDQVHVELQRRALDGAGVVIPYDPLAADPDYLVVGPVSRSWRLYDPVIASGAFRLRHVEGQYDIYERVR
ncbi:MAG TPA: hypothetical protein VER55_14240, partial [Ardenticatenaceae bacterium]|nr:hypothetical protein [Ardenticatenaceae bacterium]